MKKRIALVFGGKTSEHEVSFRSARSVYRALDAAKYEIVLIGIDKSGIWSLQDASVMGANNEADTDMREVVTSRCQVMLAPTEAGAMLVDLRNGEKLGKIDVAFPVLHGAFGEDGTVQGLFEMSDVAYVGCGVMASSVCMDKELTKRVLRDAGIPVAPFLVLRKEAQELSRVGKELGYPVFVKPACQGSSVGIGRATDEESLSKTLSEAFKYDEKVLVEQEIVGREIECSVLGNEDPKASLPGEVIPAAKYGFYSYEAKYLDADGAKLRIPAGLDASMTEEIRTIAIRTYQALGCEGMSRVDFFVRAAHPRVVVNEVNTIPGFTSISMYPKLWEVTGVAYAQLIDMLVGYAEARHERRSALANTLRRDGE